MNFMNKRASLFCSKIPKEQEIFDFLFFWNFSRKERSSFLHKIHGILEKDENQPEGLNLTFLEDSYEF